MDRLSQIRSTIVNMKTSGGESPWPASAVATIDVDGCCPSVAGRPAHRAPRPSSWPAAFAALADPVRLRLLSLIAAAGEVCSLRPQEPLGQAQPTVSHHTKVLAEAGLIVGEKRGRWMWWRIVPERLDALRAALA